MIYFELFLAFLQIGAFSVGGGYAAVPLIRAQAVEKYGWLSMGEFTDLMTISEMTPGPIAVNSATFVGARVGGMGGALVATMGCIFPSLIIVSILAAVYYRYKGLSIVNSVLQSIRPAVAALIFSAAISLLLHVIFADGQITLQAFDWIGAALFLVAFLILRIRKCSPIPVMLGCGVAGLILQLLIR